MGCADWAEKIIDVNMAAIQKMLMFNNKFLFRMTMAGLFGKASAHGWDFK
jgi:hypothetical protein